jgi:hypothetical protein
MYFHSHCSLILTIVETYKFLPITLLNVTPARYYYNEQL